jgi:subtilase family serine protease
MAKLAQYGILLLSGLAVTHANAVESYAVRASLSYIAHVPAWTRELPDLGLAPDTLLVKHVSFVIAREPQQESAFQQMLIDLYTPGSSRYHHWLTSDQLGELYAPSQKRIDEVLSWLTSSGLTVNSISRNRTVITASGSVASISKGLSTEFHIYGSPSDKRISIAVEPTLPGNLAEDIKLIDGLSTVRVYPSGGSFEPIPDVNCNSGCLHAVSPADFAKIYDLNSAYNAGLDGSGVTIAAVGFSRVAPSDIAIFQQRAGLVANVLEQSYVGTDPGPPNEGVNTYQIEATADVELAFGSAPNAQVLLDVTAAPSNGVIADLLSLPISDVIDNDRASIMTISFHGCEAGAGMAATLFADSVFQQAAAEGISVFVSAGDSGVDDCLPHGSAPPATGSPTINYLCATSYVTCVGGTEFADAADPAAYWSASQQANLLSALGYIPEGAWNESTSTLVVGGGGGTSNWISQPPWQTGTGVPATGYRNIPDLSFTASIHDPRYVCFLEADGSGDCANHKFITFYGTSGSTPSMAGIMALMDQALGGPQGNFAPSLYSLANTSSFGVFNDVTVTSSGVSGCNIETPSMCNNTMALSGSNPPVVEGYQVNVGFDLATGWGSLDVGNLLSALKSQPHPAQSATFLTSTLSNPSTDEATTLIIRVSGDAGTPTGTVQFFSNGSPYQSPVPLAFGQLSIPNLIFSPAGTYNIVAKYSGDATYAPSESSTLIITAVTPTFQITAASTALSLNAPGTTATAALTASSANGFVGNISFTCTVASSSGLQTGNLPSCTFTPSSQAALSHAAPAASVNLVVNTLAPEADSVHAMQVNPNPPSAGGSLKFLCLLAPVSLLFLRSKGRAVRQRCLVFLAMGLFWACVACSHSAGTLPGSYVITAVAKSGSQSVSTQLNLVVQ